MQTSIQPRAEYLTACKTYFKEEEKLSNENRPKIPKIRQFLNQILPISEDIFESKINLEESKRFKIV